MPAKKWAHPMGSISEDLAIVAYRVQQHLAQGEATLWIEDDGNVYCAEPRVVARIPTHWIAGTYQFAHPTQRIVDDLRMVIAERAKSWIVK